MSESEKEILKGLNAMLNKPIKDNNSFQKLVLMEKCYKGRSMSEKFLKRTKNFFPKIHSTLDRKEIAMEEELKIILQKFQIHAIMKSNKYSLPYTNVVISDAILESDINAMFDFASAYRKIILDLLTKNVFKIRFYIHIETFERNLTKFDALFQTCGIRYCFRYYIH